MKKRYLVTYSDRTIGLSEASQVLGLEAKQLNEGTKYFAESTQQDDDAIHYDKLGISVLSLEEADVSRLSDSSAVLAVEEDNEMWIQGFVSEEASLLNESTNTNLWNIEMVNAPEAWNNGYTGQGIKLAILDTGIATHPDLVISGGVSFIPNDPSYNDLHGHGTHCAGTAAGRNGLNSVYGVAKNASLYAVKVLGNDGRGSSSWIIAGMNWCITNGINVASMSLGGPNPPQVAYANAVKNCEDNGVIVVCATGNAYIKQTPSPPYPFPYVGSPANSFIAGDSNGSPIAVGAVDNNKVIASFSSRGTNGANWNPVTVVAPGVNIYSTSLNNGYATMSGTSMATPHVAGLAALVAQRYPGISPHMAMAKISSTASNLGTAPFPNVAYGYGLIDCLKATR